MKKQQTFRNVLIALVVFASLASYIYLNTVTPAVEDTSVKYELLEDEKNLQEETATNTKLLLPEMALIKKVLETGRSLMPGS